MSNQLIKTTEQGKENVFPRTRIQDLFDDTSGQKLIDILRSFNMMFVPYLGNKSQTRNQISPELRRQGLWLTYVIENTVYTEWYDEVAIDDTNWGSDSNWRQGSNALVGDLSVSPNGTWVINGEDSGITIKGDKGDSPVIRIYDNKIQVSYDKGVTYEDLNNTPIYTKFRFNSQTNTYQVSYDLGSTWQDISNEKVYHKFRYNSATNTYQESIDFGKTWSNISAEKVYYQFRYNAETNTHQVSTDLGQNWTDISSNKVYYQFRTNDNRLQVSTDLGTTWENCSEPIAAWFRWADTNGTGNVGKVQISRDNNTWSDLSPVMTNNLYIKGYVATVGNLPSSAAIGDIYMVGPTYDESDTTQDYPHYRMWVKQSSGWVDNGEFTNAGPVGTNNIIDNSVTTSKLVDGAITIGKIADNAIDDVPTSGSDNLVKSGGVFSLISAEIARAKAAEETNAQAIATVILSDNIEFNRVVKELYIEKLDETYSYDYSSFNQLELYINADSGNWRLILASSENNSTIGLNNTTSKPKNGFYMFVSSNYKFRAYMLINWDNGKDGVKIYRDSITLSNYVSSLDYNPLLASYFSKRNFYIGDYATLSDALNSFLEGGDNYIDGEMLTFRKYQLQSRFLVFYNTTIGKYEYYIYNERTNPEYNSNFLNVTKWKRVLSSDDLENLEGILESKVDANVFKDFDKGGLINGKTGQSASSSQYNMTTGIKVIRKGYTKIRSYCSQTTQVEDNACIVILDENLNVIANSGTNTQINVCEYKELDIPNNAKFYAINCSNSALNDAFYQIYGYNEGIEQILTEKNTHFNAEGFISCEDGNKYSSSQYNMNTGFIYIKKNSVAFIRAFTAQTIVDGGHGAIILFDKDKNIVSFVRNKVAYTNELVYTQVPDNVQYFVVNCATDNIKDAWYEIDYKEHTINSEIFPKAQNTQVNYNPINTACNEIAICSHKGFRYGQNGEIYTYSSPFAYANASFIGYKWWEIDIQVTADSHWVVIHDIPMGWLAKIYDKTLERFITEADNFRVEQFTLAQIKERFVWEDGGDILSLQELFQLASFCNCGVRLEFKSDWNTVLAEKELKDACIDFGIQKIIYNCTSTDWTSIFPKLVSIGIYSAGNLSTTNLTMDNVTNMFKWASEHKNTSISVYGGSSSEEVTYAILAELSFEYNVPLSDLRGVEYGVCAHDVTSDVLCSKLGFYSNRQTIMNNQDVSFNDFNRVDTFVLDKPSNVLLTVFANKNIVCKIDNNTCFSLETSFALNAGTHSIYIKGNGKIKSIILQY